MVELVLVFELALTTEPKWMTDMQAHLNMLVLHPSYFEVSASVTSSRCHQYLTSKRLENGTSIFCVPTRILEPGQHRYQWVPVWSVFNSPFYTQLKRGEKNCACFFGTHLYLYSSGSVFLSKFFFEIWLLTAVHDINVA
jgi:hypothetical protein